MSRPENAAVHRRPRRRTPREREATARHEAGHAVVCHHLLGSVRRVDITETADALGSCEGPDLRLTLNPGEALSPAGREKVERRIMVLLAGPIAERQLSGRYCHVGASHDYQVSFHLASVYCQSDASAEAFLKWLWVRTEELLELPFVRGRVDAVAMALLERGELSGREVRRIVCETDTREAHAS